MEGCPHRNRVSFRPAYQSVLHDNDLCGYAVDGGAVCLVAARRVEEEDPF